MTREITIKVGSTELVAARMAGSDDNLIILVKETEIAIPSNQIDRIDARSSTGNRVTKETTTKDGVGPDGSQASSTSKGYSLGGKPDFETVYRRPSA